MDENNWQLAQLIMWSCGIQTSLLIAAFTFIWAHFNKRIDKMEERQTRFEYDMIEIKTILRMKECCMIKDDRQMKKAD